MMPFTTGDLLVALCSFNLLFVVVFVSNLHHSFYFIFLNFTLKYRNTDLCVCVCTFLFVKFIRNLIPVFKIANLLYLMLS